MQFQMNLKYSRDCHQSKCIAPVDTQRLGYNCPVLYFHAHCKTLRTWFVSRTWCRMHLIPSYRFHGREHRGNDFWISVPP